MKYIPQRGDIAWIDFGPPVGHEQAHRRPALILTPVEYNTVFGLAAVCPITSKAKGFRFEVRLPPVLETKGVILSHQFRSVAWRFRRIEFKERASQETLDEVLARIAALLE